MNRGSDSRCVLRPGGNPASMRPRFMNRGSQLPLQARSLHTGSFNEAPIHESGKCPLPPPVTLPTQGFNEAPIHESGKSQRRWTRSRNRKCFNEAPIHESGKSQPTRTRPPSSPSASMRPRFMNRGSASRPQRSDPRLWASMRPRFMNRGSQTSPGPRPYPRQSFNEAPIHESGKSPSRVAARPAPRSLQ